MSLRISTTWLESYRRIHEEEYGNEKELIDTISGVPWVGRWQMYAGSSWDAALSGVPPHETIADSEPIIQRWGDYWFSAQEVETARKVCGPGQCQLKFVHRVPTKFGDAALVAKLDHFYGVTVTDNKAKFSSPDIKDYERSLQWRCYLFATGAERFRYLLWDFKNPDGGGYCSLKGWLRFYFYPYPDLEREVLEWIESFLSWAKNKDLLGFMEPLEGAA